MKLIKIIGTGVFVSLACTQLAAQSPTDSLRNKFDMFMKNSNTMMNTLQENTDSAYNAFENSENAAFNTYKRKVDQLWGTFKESTNTVWVSYRNNNSARTAVDFEGGTITVEVLTDPDENEDQVKEKLKKLVEEVIKDDGTKPEFPSPNTPPAPPKNTKPILKDQLNDESGKKVNDSTVDKFAEDIVAQKKPTKEAVTTEDNQRKTKHTITIALAPDHIQTRAKQFYGDISVYSKKYDLDPSLVLAVIHTESFFNPKAKSHAPAYGLMQLVPRFGAREAYQTVYSKDVIPKPSYLYQPEKNIELGCAYLRVLQDRYFSNIENDENRLYCAISAYNTGAGNVSKAFTGNTNIKKAIPQINNYAPTELYQYLHENLPYKETREYLKKVTERMANYEKWQN